MRVSYAAPKQNTPYCGPALIGSGCSLVPSPPLHRSVCMRYNLLGHHPTHRTCPTAGCSGSSSAQSWPREQWSHMSVRPTHLTHSSVDSDVKIYRRLIKSWMIRCRTHGSRLYVTFMKQLLMPHKSPWGKSQRSSRAGKDRPRPRTHETSIPVPALQRAIVGRSMYDKMRTRDTTRLLWYAYFGGGARRVCARYPYCCCSVFAGDRRFDACIHLPPPNKKCAKVRSTCCSYLCLL